MKVTNLSRLTNPISAIDSTVNSLQRTLDKSALQRTAKDGTSVQQMLDRIKHTLHVLKVQDPEYFVEI